MKDKEIEHNFPLYGKHFSILVSQIANIQENPSPTEQGGTLFTMPRQSKLWSYNHLFISLADLLVEELSLSRTLTSELRSRYLTSGGVTKIIEKYKMTYILRLKTLAETSNICVY